MKLIAKQAFSWAHRGCDVEHFAEGQEIDTDDQDLISVSVSEGWASEDGETKPERSKKAKPGAPENKSE